MLTEVPKGFPAPPRSLPEQLSVTEFLRRKCSHSASSPDFPEEDSPAHEFTRSNMSMGLWAHRVLQVVLGGKAKGDLESTAREEAGKLFGQAPIPEQSSQVAQLCANFLNSSLGQVVLAAPRRLCEFPLIIEQDGVILKAKLDLIYGNASAWAIIDFKSGGYPSAELLELYSEQLKLYALGWQALTGIPPAKASLFFLETAETHDTPL
jgi:ATP-dependent exoDNAse (exonuclease V) beta subunit